MSDTASTPSTPAEHQPSSAETLADSLIWDFEDFVGSLESRRANGRITSEALLDFMIVSRDVMDDHGKTLTGRDSKSLLASITEFSLFQPTEEEKQKGLPSWYSFVLKTSKLERKIANDFTPCMSSIKSS
jgi:hypothetical protein